MSNGYDITTKQAAEILGIDVKKLYYLVETEKLKARKIGQKLKLSSKQVEEFKARRSVSDVKVIQHKTKPTKKAIKSKPKQGKAIVIVSAIDDIPTLIDELL